MKKLKRLIKLISNPNAANFQKGFAYSLLLSLAPVAIAFFLVFRYLSLDFTVYMEVLYEYLPSYLVDGFKVFLATNSTSELLSMLALILLGINVASKSLLSYLQISNFLNKSSYPGWFLKILSFAGMISWLVSISVVVYTFSFLPFTGVWIQALILFITILLFFKMVSLDRGRFQDIVYGSLFTTLAFMVIGRSFGWYVSNFTNYQSVYGPLASLMIFLLLLLIVSNVIYIGFCINVVYRDQHYVAQENRFFLFLQNLLTKLIPKRFRKEDVDSEVRAAQSVVSDAFDEKSER